MRRTRFAAATIVAMLVSVGGLPGLASAAIPGSQLWAQRYNGSARYDYGWALAVSPDGTRVFVTGQSSGSGSYEDFATIAYDATTGEKIWSRRYDGPAHGRDRASAIGVSPDGSTVFVTGGSDGFVDNGGDMATVAYEAATGATSWVRRNSSGSASALEVSPDGSTVYVTGSHRKRTSYHDYVTAAYDTVTGTKRWAERYDGPRNSFDLAYDLGVSPDGARVFVTGASIGSTTNYDYFTIAYDADAGDRLWAGRYSRKPHSLDYAYALAMSPHGSKVYVTGQSTRSQTSDPVTVAYAAATGAKLWVKRYDDGSRSWYDSANDIGVSPDGSLVFTTGEGGAHRTNYATVAFDSITGAKVWATHYRGTSDGSDSAYALGVSPDGSRLYVTGESDGSTSASDYATIAYDATTGATVWKARYNGTGNFVDLAADLGVSSDGSKVFVTGYSVGSTSEVDYATVAYSAA
jgi:sugar lactone lactonase YvrE